MKLKILNLEGKETKEIESRLFEERARPDILQKVVEAEKAAQPYAPGFLSGKKASASGKIRHGRRKWKTAYGKGISRVPRKLFWRRGTQFYWQAATIASAVKGRRAHPPKILARTIFGKINKKEIRKAFLSAFTLTSSVEQMQKKYKSLEGTKIKIELPLIIQDEITMKNTKEFIQIIENILGDISSIALKERTIRPGIGKSRGRRYKENSGMLMVVGNGQNEKISCIEIKKANELTVSDLASNGARLVMYTESAIKDLEKKFLEGNIKEEEEKTHTKKIKGEK